MRILVVDDEKTVRRSCERILAIEGHDVLSVPRGEEGLERLVREGFDVVLLDLMMPGMGGLETLRLLRTMDGAIPVVVMTGYAKAEVEEECRRLGATVWLPKPFGPDELLGAIARGLESSDPESLDPEGRTDA
ncbi:MAG: response regulator [Planctomycetota bacterium]